MAHAYRSLRSGLVVAEDAVDESRLRHALRQIDDRLALQKEQNPLAPGGWAYRVLYITSEDKPPEQLLTWTDEYGNWLPLSSGLLEKVDKHRRDGRHHGPDADERNQQLVESARKQGAESAAAVDDDHRAKVERGRVTVSLAPGTSKPYWQRNHHLPDRIRKA